jgi:hypothetical protein
MSRFVIILTLIFCYGIIPVGAMQVTYVDTTHCTVKTFDEKYLAGYRTQPEFNYETTPAKGNGFFGLLALLLAEFFDSLGKTHVGKLSLYDVLFYGLAIFAAIMIVLQFFKLEVSGIFANNPGALAKHHAFTENVHELDFDALIADALKNTNYRLATRLYYLKTLKKLSDGGLINWQKNKTNFEYYYELKGIEQRQQFYHLTLLFESVWYGNHQISASDFDENMKSFTGFLQNLKR